jgi:2'-hydroxyisoflavone reductase
MTRREFVKAGAATGLASALVSEALTAGIAPPRPLRLLILGGTGFTGPHQVRYALSRGHHVTLFNRGRRPQDWPGAVEELTGDRDKGELKALEGREWDVCIDNPTTLPFWVRDAGRVLAGKIKHFVFISTLSVYADTSRPGMDETTPTAVYSGPDAMRETMAAVQADMRLYGPLKALCEREAETWFPGITTVLRPTLIVGPGDETDRFTYWPVRIARGGDVLVPSEDGRDPYQVIDARDLAEWTVRLAEQRTFGVFNAAGPAIERSFAHLASEVKAGVGGDARFTYLPTSFLTAQKVAPWRDLPAWVPGEGDTAGFARMSTARAQAAGLTYRPLRQTAADTLAWYQGLPEPRRSKLRSGLSAQRETEVLAAWNAARAPGSAG